MKILIAFLAVLLIAVGTAEAASLITGKDVKNGSLTGKDVKNRSITSRDLRGPLPISAAQIHTVYTTATYGPGAVEILSVDCDAGENVVSGGWTIIGGNTIPFVDKSYDERSWSVGVDNFNSSITADTEVYATCAPAGELMTASHRGSPARDLAAQRATHR